MNGLVTCVDLNVPPLGSYDVLIGMDWLEAHRVKLDCYNNTFECTSVQGTLQDEYTGYARIEDATARVVGQEVYPTECVSLGRTSPVCKEERWYTQVVY